jgi:hypothetical protein
MYHNNPYFSIGKFVFRTPAFSIQENFEALLKSDAFWEAIYLASPSLYKECERKNFVLDKNKKKTIYKYYIRSTTRCTPFGLFAGCSVGEISDKTEFEIAELHDFYRKTRLDMYFLSILVDKIEHIEIIRRQLKYMPNTSIYRINSEIRYIEYRYQKARRIHNIVCIEENQYLNKVLQISKKGMRFHEIASTLVDNEINMEAAVEFVEELIESQVLRSELEVHVTGENVFDSLIDKLAQLENSNILCVSLKNISNLLSQINSSSIGSSINLYDEIINEINILNIPYEESYLFQTDLFKPAIKSKIAYKVIDEVKELLHFLNCITPKFEINARIREFKKKFYARYEEQEIPLMEALDSDCGIGYGDMNPNIDFNALIKDVVFPSSNSNNQNRVDLSQYYANEILSNSWNNTKEIAWNDKLIKNVNDAYAESPESLNVCISLVKDDSGNDLILLNGVWFGATNILGRFCCLNAEIYDIVKQVADWEEKKKQNSLIAAIVHLPDSRMGNIMFRPNTIRNYEIPYLAGSQLSIESQIPVSDLTLSIRHNKIILKSKKYQKEVIPKLDNAHNYTKSPTPVYNFLCDMQGLPEIYYLGFQYDTFFNYFDYTPRIRYKNIIVKKAQWKIKYSDMKEKKMTDNEGLIEFLKTKNIPRHLCVSQGDNVLNIDCEQELAIDILLDHIKKNDTVLIEESFNYINDSCVVYDSMGKPFVNEIVIPFLKKIEV